LLPFGEGFVVWALATVIPAFVGLILIAFVGRVAGQRYSAAFALGIFFWFFVDTIQGSSNLLVNFGFAGGVRQAGMMLLFVFGVALLFLSDTFVGGNGLFSQESGAGRSSFAIPVLVALAVGIHGLGEGTAFGSTAAQTSSATLLDAFGGISSGVAYLLHKMLEPMMIGALYVAYSKGTARSTIGSLRDLLALTFLFALPSLIGAAIGYFINYNATYFFGLGAGTSIYVALRLARQTFDSAEQTGRYESLKVSFALILGFILIYVAALFHA
jgi:hypothetical protein